MDSWFMMLIHSIVIALVLYVVMIYVLKQSAVKAEYRSVLIGALVWVYMLVFGHGFPTSINKKLL